MIIDAKYYVGDIEYSTEEMLRAAVDMGWKGLDRRLINFRTTTDDAIRYFISKGHSVKTVIIGNCSGEEVPSSPLLTDKSPEKPYVPLDPGLMKIYYENKVYTVDTTKVDDMSCWDVQLFGSMACTQCKYRASDVCMGQSIVDSGINQLGHEIPLAVKIIDRPIRKEK